MSKTLSGFFSNSDDHFRQHKVKVEEVARINAKLVFGSRKPHCVAAVVYGVISEFRRALKECAEKELEIPNELLSPRSWAKDKAWTRAIRLREQLLGLSDEEQTVVLNDLLVSEATGSEADADLDAAPVFEDADAKLAAVEAFVSEVGRIVATRLEPTERRLLTLMVCEELPVREVASRLGMPLIHVQRAWLNLNYEIAFLLLAEAREGDTAARFFVNYLTDLERTQQVVGNLFGLLRTATRNKKEDLEFDV